MTDRTVPEGPMTVLGRLPDSSNNALLCSIDGTRVVYKPTAGERPLWDFPSGTLSRRERAAAELDRILGWGLVPATRWIDDGPAGPGVLQLWVDGRIDLGIFEPGTLPPEWVAVVDAETEDGPVVVAHRDDGQTRRLIVFDAIANNADRKGGHLLRTESGLHAIDHGVTFHVEPKLRTVLWGLAGTAIDDQLLAEVERAADGMDELSQWLAADEVRAVRDRVRAVLAAGTFPSPTGEWPALPWPLI